MAALIEAIDVKRKMFIEHEGTPYHCMDVEVSRPTARGGQTLVRLRMRNLLTRAVFVVQVQKFNGRPIGLQLPPIVELAVASTEPGVRGDTAAGVTKVAVLETGLELRVPLFIREGEKVKVHTETREFAGRA
jgi:elongation factor P